jgi:hypothetical protein
MSAVLRNPYVMIILHGGLQGFFRHRIAQMGLTFHCEGSRTDLGLLRLLAS